MESTEKKRIRQDIANLKNWLKDDNNSFLKESIKDQIKKQKQLLKTLN